MARVSPIQSSLNAGELSPLMMGRVDQAVYSIAGERMENFIPLIQGPMAKRPGTRHVALAKGPFRPIPFEFNTTQTYVVEAGEEYFRFFTNDAQILDEEDDPYELETPYSHAEVLRLGLVQSNDVLYLFHGSHQTRTLSRTAASSFALAAWETELGPFDDENADEALSVAATASTGDVTLYALGHDLFEAGHVGGLFSMEARDLSEIPSWEPDITIAAGALRQWSGKVYMCVTAGAGARTGTVPPIHSSGTEWDGMGSGTRTGGAAAGGVQWEYVHDRFGVLKITAFHSARKVDATVLKRLPFGTAAANSYDGGIGFTPPYPPTYTDGGGRTYHGRYTVDEVDGVPDFDPIGDDYTPEPGEDAAGYALPGTWRWAFGAFSEANGWPDCGFIWNERMVLAKGATLYGSVVGSYRDFRSRNESGEVSADMAFRFTLNSPNAIRWIIGDVQLLVGTAKKEHVAQAAGEGVPGPFNFAAPSHTSYGSAAIEPLLIGGRVLFVEKDGRKLREFDFQLARERFAAADLTIRASHLTKSGIKWLAYQAAPHSLVWAGMGNGTMAVMTYDPEQEVKAWAPVTLAPGSKAERGCVILDPEGETDQLWLYVERGGAHWVERLAAFRDIGDAREDAFHVDHGLSYDGEPITMLTNLEHLVGQDIRGLADGEPFGPVTVDEEGEAALPGEASKVHAGLYFGARFKSLRIDAGGDDGTTQGKTKRISQLAVRLLDSGGLRVRVQDGEWEEVEFHDADMEMDAAPPLFTGDVMMQLIGDYERDGQCEIETTEPLPACVVALTPTLTVGRH